MGADDPGVGSIAEEKFARMEEEYSMTLYMETTRIPAEKTAQEVSFLLGQAGAGAIQMEFRDKKIYGLCFLIQIQGKPVPFRLPVRTAAVFEYLNRKRSIRTRTKLAGQDLEQAERVAWRQILKWIQAQLALIETGMVSLPEVFLPYLQTNINETLYERLEASKFKELPVKCADEEGGL